MNHLMLEGILVRRGALAPHGWLVSGSFVFVSDLKKFRGFNTCAGDYALGTVRRLNCDCGCVVFVARKSGPPMKYARGPPSHTALGAGPRGR